MNNQMPYGFMQQPQCNCNMGSHSEINERLDSLEKKVKRLEKRVMDLERLNMTPTPYTNFNNQDFPNNYMI